MIDLTNVKGYECSVSWITDITEASGSDVLSASLAVNRLRLIFGTVFEVHQRFAMTVIICNVLKIYLVGSWSK